MPNTLELTSRLHDAAADVVAAVVEDNQHVLLAADVPSTTLDDVARRLSASRSRVLRPATRDRLTLAGLLAQVVGRPADGNLDPSDLEGGFDLLTGVDAGCDRVVLILDRADAVDPAALRYLQLAMRDAPLRLVCAGGTEFRAMLALDEFAATRRALGLPPERPIAPIALYDEATGPADYDSDTMRPISTSAVVERMTSSVSLVELEMAAPNDSATAGRSRDRDFQYTMSSPVLLAETDTPPPSDAMRGLVAWETDALRSAGQSQDELAERTGVASDAEPVAAETPATGRADAGAPTIQDIAVEQAKLDTNSSFRWGRWVAASLVLILAGGAVWYSRPDLATEFVAKLVAAWHAVVR